MKKYKIIIEVDDNGQGQELWRNVSEETLKDEEMAGKLLVDMMDTLDGEVKF